ncbi:RluA family pseudouridine synthase [Candidatus Dependentiae bacterium]
MEKIQIIKPGSTHTFEVTVDQEGQRIDCYLADQFKSYSRSFFEKLIEKKLVKLNNKTINKKSIPLKSSDTIEVKFPEEKKKSTDFKNKLENLNIKIVYEHKHFVILNKPSDLIVHPPYPQSQAVTLVDWILKNIDEVSNVGFDDRPGIVHRLDKDTTGLIIIPKNNCAHAYFSDMFKERKIQKTYLAIVKNHPYKEGEIDYDIARNPSDKSKMVHVTTQNLSKIKSKIRRAKTIYKVLEYYEEFSLVQVKPITGRTHQIRVHFAAIKHPLLGDCVYGQTSKIIPRHALHAYELEFEFEGEKIQVCQEPPQDFQKALEILRKK